MVFSPVREKIDFWQLTFASLGCGERWLVTRGSTYPLLGYKSSVRPTMMNSTQ